MTEPNTTEKLRALALVMVTILSVVAMTVTITGSAAGNHAEGDVRIVDGDSEGTGHYETIQGAVDAAESGDRIEVRPGTYHEQVEIEDPALSGDKNGITLIAPDGAAISPELEDELNPWIIRLGIGGRSGTLENVTIEGFTLVGDENVSDDEGISMSNGIDLGMEGHRIANNTIRNVGRGIEGWGSNITVEDNEITDFTTGAIRVAINEEGNMVRDNNISSQGGDYGVQITDGEDGSGTAHEVTVEENNFTGEGYSPVVVETEVAGADVDLGEIKNDNSFESVVVVNEAGDALIFAPVVNVDQAEGYATIQEAIGEAGNDNTIEVESGTYDEQIVVAEDNVTLTTATDAEPTIVGNVSVTASNVTVRGFEITGDSIGVDIRSDGAPEGVRIEDNHIHDIDDPGGRDGKESFGVMAWASSSAIQDITIRNNRIEDIGSNSTGAQGFGIFIEGLTKDGDGATIENNTIRNITSTSLADDPYPGVGIGLLPELTNPENSVNDTSEIVSNESNADVTGNTIEDNPVGISVAGNVSQTNISGNVFQDNEVTVLTEGNIPSEGTIGISALGDESESVITDGPVDATENWWGDDDGPGEKDIIGSVAFDPWYVDVDLSTLSDEEDDTSGSPSGGGDSGDDDNSPSATGTVASTTGSAEASASSVGRRLSVTVEDADTGDTMQAQREDEEVREEVRRHGTALERIEITFRDEEELDVQIDASREKPQPSIPDPPSEKKAAGYFDVKHSSEEAIEEVRFDFRTSRERLEAVDIDREEVTLYRYSDEGEWSLLETEVVGRAEDDSIRYRAASPGLSVFAIAGSPGQETTPDEEPTTPESGTPTPEDATAGPPDTDEPPTSSSPGQPGFGLALALLAVAVTSLLAARRRS